MYYSHWIEVVAVAGDASRQCHCEQSHHEECYGDESSHDLSIICVADCDAASAQGLGLRVLYLTASTLFGLTFRETSLFGSQ